MTTFRNWIILSFSIFYSFFLTAQSNPVSKDSLELLIKKSFDYAYDYDYKNAIKTGHIIVDQALLQSDYYYATRGNSRIASIYLSMKDTANSLKYYRKSLEYAKRSQLDSTIASVHNDIGNVYMEMGGSLEKARESFQQSIALAEKSGESDRGKLPYLVNMAWVHLELEEPIKALPLLNKSVKIVVENPNLHPLYSINLDNLRGRYHTERGNYKKAISLLRSVATRTEKGNFLNEASQAQHQLSKAYQKNGELALAIASLEKEIVFNNKLNEIIRNQQLQEASAKFSLEQAEKELALATNEKELSSQLASKSRQLSRVFIITSIVLLFSLLSLYLLLKNRKKYITNLNQKNKELKAAKEEAERLSKLKTQFFSTISHELRTPLYGVIGLSSTLLEDEKLSSHKDDLKSLKFSADYLLALINDVLTLNKADANGMKLEQNPFNLDILIKNITDSFTFSLQQNNNKIKTIIEDEVPRNLLGDSIKLSQILMNLVGNANKFNENGTIEIVIKSLGQVKPNQYRLHFFIKDNGIGIPIEKQISIFEEFSQVENNNYNYQGTGLGLPIVKKLLALFNSKIELKSEVGNGSIFSFQLILEKSAFVVENKPLSLYNSQLEQTSTFENIHVLIVDDNKINQKVTQKILEAKNFTCSLADDGIQAVAMAQKNNYGLILMDIHMPNMGGIEATKTIRSFHKNLPIIALTAVEIEEMRSQIISSGMNDIILKPYDVSQFFATIYRNLTPSFTYKSKP